MGNGLAIYNETDFVITCEASMGIIHKSENHVQPGQTFYYHSGAVWMTLTAYPTTSTTTVSAYRRAKRNKARMKLITDIGDHVETVAASVSNLSLNKVAVVTTCWREAAKVWDKISQ